MEKKKAVWIGVLGFLTFVFLLIVIFGDSPEEAAEKQRLLTEQAQREDAIRAEQKANQCPKQGILQSDWDYCVELCVLGKSDALINEEQCEKICDTTEYYQGSEGLQKRIMNYKCKKCGECTEEQLKEMNVSNEVEE